MSTPTTTERQFRKAKVRLVETVTTLADHASVVITVHHIALGSAENGWGHAYFRAHCDVCGWIGHDQGNTHPEAAERIGIRHANADPHDPDGANRWINPDGTFGGYDGSAIVEAVSR